MEDHIITLFPESNKAGGHRLGIASGTSSEEEDFTAFAARTPQSSAAVAFSTPVSAVITVVILTKNLTIQYLNSCKPWLFFQARYRTQRDVRNYNGTPINGNRSQLHSSFHGTPRDVLDSSRPREVRGFTINFKIVKVLYVGFCIAGSTPESREAGCSDETDGASARDRTADHGTPGGGSSFG